MLIAIAHQLRALQWLIWHIWHARSSCPAYHTILRLLIPEQSGHYRVLDLVYLSPTHETSAALPPSQPATLALHPDQWSGPAKLRKQGSVSFPGSTYPSKSRIHALKKPLELSQATSRYPFIAPVQSGRKTLRGCRGGGERRRSMTVEKLKMEIE